MKINCYRCVHFFITYQQSQPYGCRAYGFKSKAMPSIVVQQSSNVPCGAFTEKPNKAAGK